MKVVRQARLELSGGSTPDQLRPPSLYKVPTYSTRVGAAPRAPGRRVGQSAAGPPGGGRWVPQHTYLKMIPMTH